MECEAIVGKLAVGEALGADEAAHVAACPRCGAAVALAGRIAARHAAPGALGGAVPTVQGLRRRERALRVRQGVAVAAVLVLGLLVGVRVSRLGAPGGAPSGAVVATVDAAGATVEAPAKARHGHRTHHGEDPFDADPFSGDPFGGDPLSGDLLGGLAEGPTLPGDPLRASPFAAPIAPSPDLSSPTDVLEAALLGEGSL